MAKISMLVPDDLLKVIDAESGGNLTAFMIEASLDLARRKRREAIDREIVAALEGNRDADARVAADWDVTSSDGLG